MFQTLDEKNFCNGIYENGNIIYGQGPSNFDKTWNYCSFLKGKNIDFAQIYCNGKSLDDVCPEYLKVNLKLINNKIKSHINSILYSKISLKDNCFYNLIPERILKEYCELKNKISNHVFDTYKKPEQYDFYRELMELTTDISHRDLNIDRNILNQKLYIPQAKNLLDKINNSTKIKYNLFNSITGRLSLQENSFPILNLSAKLRSSIKPTNDWFVCLDLNAAEIRMALALAGEQQPEGDLHEISLNTVFNNEVTRTQAKNITTQWLYDSQSELCKKYDVNLSKFYNKQKLINKYWHEGEVHTPYGRIIPADRHHILSYLNQSSLIDMWHRQILKANKKLDNKKSFLAFLVHDQAVFDLADEEKNILLEIVSELSNTPYGKFPIKVEIGKDYGNLKKIKLKE